MAIEVASSFDMKSQLPVDGRYVVADTTARDAIDSGVRHEGMQVYVKADKTIYHLKGGITNGDWEKLGTGGGGASAQFMGGGTVSWLTDTKTVSLEQDVQDNHLNCPADELKGQSFVSPGGSVTKATFRLSYIPASPASSGYVVAKIYNTSAGLPTGSAIAESAQVAYTEISEAHPPVDDIEFTFSSCPNLTEDSTYVIAFENKTDAFVRCGITTTGPFTDGEAVQTASSVWEAVATDRDMVFYVELDQAKPAFNFTENIKLGLPGLSPTDNIIEPPATPYFLEDGEFLYVVPNDAPGGAALIPQVTTGPIPEDALVVAFRDGDDLVAAGYRMKQGYQAKLGGGSLVLPPMHKQAVIDLTGSGDFTAGKILVERNGGKVVVSGLTSHTFSSSAVPVSADGALPEWARPASQKQNVFRAVSDVIGTVYVTENGAMGFLFRDFANSSTAQTSTTAIFSITYSVEDNSSNIVDVAELGIKTAKVLLTSDDQPSIGTTATKITFNNVVKDELGLYSSGKFTAPSRMAVDIMGLLTTDSETWAAGNSVAVRAYVNGVQRHIIGIKRFETAATQGADVPISATIDLEKGDELEIYASSSVATNILNSATSNLLSIQARPDLTAIAAIGGKMPDPISASSSTKTPSATTQWQQHTGNSLTLTPDDSGAPAIWELCPSQCVFAHSGTSPGYTAIRAKWSAANGADSTTEPDGLSTLSGVTILSPSSNPGMTQVSATLGSPNYLTTNTVLMKVTEEVTVYLNTLAVLSTASNARITVHPVARRIA